jgi:hypothetical protein
MANKLDGSYHVASSSPLLMKMLLLAAAALQLSNSSSSSSSKGPACHPHSQRAARCSNFTLSE